MRQLLFLWLFPSDVSGLLSHTDSRGRVEPSSLKKWGLPSHCFSTTKMHPSKGQIESLAQRGIRWSAALEVRFSSSSGYKKIQQPELIVDSFLTTVQMKGQEPSI